MLSMLFIVAICATNFVIGFGLALKMGHGPAKLVQAFAAKSHAAAAHEAEHSAEAPPSN